MLKNEVQKNILTAGMLLALFALVGAGSMSVVNWHSKPFIAENERIVLLRTLNAIIPPGLYDNDILSDTIMMSDQKMLGFKEPTIVYRARTGGKPVAAAMKIVAPKGYSGPIVLLIGINFSGQVIGVRVIKHRETPGLGDGIEIQRSNWIESFNGKSRQNPEDAGWKVKRDGGEFDEFTGATITPRAIVSAVHKALAFFEQNKSAIFKVPELENLDINKDHNE